MLEEVVHRLLPFPPQNMHAGIDHEASRAMRLGRQESHMIDVGRKQSHLVCQPFGVQPPVLAETREEEIAAYRMQLLVFHGHGDLEVVAGIRLVKRC